MNYKDESRYAVWLGVIIVGVTCGNLLSAWITASVVEIQVQNAVYVAQEEQKKSEERDAQAMMQAKVRLMAQQEAMAAQARSRRQQDSMGRHLEASCQDWQRAQTQFNSATTAAEMTRNCGRYERYISTGQL